jgi:hypothetical protein
MVSAEAPRLLDFYCPGCGQRCQADTRANTVRHELPTCKLYKRCKPIDFITASGVGMAAGDLLKRGAP